MYSHEYMRFVWNWPENVFIIFVLIRYYIKLCTAIIFIDENTVGRDPSTSIIWKNASEIGIGVAFTNEVEDIDGEIVKQPMFIIALVINPMTNVIGEYKENIKPRITDLMIKDGYFQKLKDSSKTKIINRCLVRVKCVVKKCYDTIVNHNQKIKNLSVDNDGW